MRRVCIANEGLQIIIAGSNFFFVLRLRLDKELFKFTDFIGWRQEGECNVIV